MPSAPWKYHDDTTRPDRIYAGVLFLLPHAACALLDRERQVPDRLLSNACIAAGLTPVRSANYGTFDESMPSAMCEYDRTESCVIF